MIYANDYVRSTDSETLNAAIAAREADGIVVISPRVSDVDPERDFWLLDEAILLPENTTVILQNCKIKLSDNCRDNFFRTANCGLGIADPAPISNIHHHRFGYYGTHGRRSRRFCRSISEPSKSWSVSIAGNSWRKRYENSNWIPTEVLVLLREEFL